MSDYDYISMHDDGRLDLMQRAAVLVFGYGSREWVSIRDINWNFKRTVPPGTVETKGAS